MLIVDTPYNTTAKVSALQKNNIGTVIRYYNFSNSKKFPDKCLTLIEAQSICEAGMSIAVVFQQNQNSAGDFSDYQGYEAGLKAYRYAMNDIGQPKGSAIYFSVDFDADDDQIHDHIVPYFQGVQRAFNQLSNGQPDYRVGVYGSGATGSTLFQLQLCSLIWLSMSAKFNGTQNALAKGTYNLLQRAPSAILCGLGIDYNQSNPQQSDFGAFTLAHAASEPLNAHLPFNHEVISRTDLMLRGGPGTSYSVVDRLKSGQQVVATAVNQEWSSIDLHGDGLIDGFAASAYLKEL